MRSVALRVSVVAAATLLAACAAPSPKPVPPAPPTAPIEIPPPPPPPPPTKLTPPPPPGDHPPILDPASRVPPTYPGFDVIYALGGRTLLDATISDTGAIVDIRIEQSSGHRELDDAAINAVRRWRFAPGNRGGYRAGAVVRVPIKFNPQPSGHAPINHFWPQGYAHPRYVADATPIPYASVDAAYEHVPADTHRPLQDAHAIEQLLVHDARGQLVQWWIFTDLDTPNAMATRLTFRGTPADPVVAVSSLCTRPDVCAARQAITLQGPVFAHSLQ